MWCRLSNKTNMVSDKALFIHSCKHKSASWSYNKIKPIFFLLIFTHCMNKNKPNCFSKTKLKKLNFISQWLINMLYQLKHVLIYLVGKDVSATGVICVWGNRSARKKSTCPSGQPLTFLLVRVKESNVTLHVNTGWVKNIVKHSADSTNIYKSYQCDKRKQQQYSLV